MAQFPTPFPDPNDGLLLGDIFSGIGGWELAAGADWQCVLAAEMEPNARKVWEANHGRAPDVGDILLAPTSEASFAHVFTVSFPCQSSSQAGKRQGGKDPRGEKVLGQALSMVGSARPLLVVFENVKGFKSVQNGAYFLWLENRLLETEFQAPVKVRFPDIHVVLMCLGVKAASFVSMQTPTSI